MQYEKPHDSFHWSNKLDELDRLPGEPLTDKAAAWEKLQGRMQGRARKSRTIPYWMVAASLLLVIGVSWFLTDQKTPGHLQEDEQQPGKELVIAPIPVIHQKDTVAQASMVQKERKPAMAIESKYKRPDHLQLETTASSDKQTKQNPDIEIEPLPEITNNTTSIIDTTTSIAVLPVKKKMRVVHINELSRPEEESQLVRKPSFQSNPFTKDAGLISISRNASDNLIRIKLSPSN